MQETLSYEADSSFTSQEIPHILCKPNVHLNR
jgi:hypothetical protein